MENVIEPHQLNEVNVYVIESYNGSGEKRRTTFFIDLPPQSLAAQRE